MSSSLEGGGGRDSGHIRFALTAITGNFAASSVKREIYTAGGSAGGRPCLPLPGEDEPKEKKGKRTEGRDVSVCGCGQMDPKKSEILNNSLQK